VVCCLMSGMLLYNIISAIEWYGCHLPAIASLAARCCQSWLSMVYPKGYTRQQSDSEENKCRVIALNVWECECTCTAFHTSLVLYRQRCRALKAMSGALCVAAAELRDALLTR
jgi:hypothetical protein